MKFQTRRVINPQPSTNLDWVTEWGWTFFTPDKHISGRVRNPSVEPREIFLPCPYSLGQRLWVRETWATVDYEYEYPGIAVRYRADPGCTDYWCSHEWIGSRGGDSDKYMGAKFNSDWRPSIFMPRFASRITLEVTGVKVERVQSISDDDAIAEGVDRTNTSIVGYATQRYRKLWDSINGKRTGCSWVENPLVWAIEFRRNKP